MRKRFTTGGLVALGVLALIVGGAAVYVATALVGGEASKLANPAREKSVLFDPNNSIGTYESFYDKCRAVVALEQQAALAEDEAQNREASYDADNDPFGNERRAISAVRENARALRSRQIGIAEEYNADAAKTTRAQFRAADLPYTIESPYADVQCGDPKEAGR